MKKSHLKHIIKEIIKEELFSENIRQAKQYISSGKISQEDFDSLLDIDPTKDTKKKYIGWLSKIWISGNKDLDELRNYISEYDTLLRKGKIKTKDINQHKNFNSLKSEVDILNKTGESLSSKDLENDYTTIKNTDDILIMSPHTHEASRKLGLSHFSYRDCDGGTKDSTWCTTYKTPSHFNSYYWDHNLTFYYIKVKSEDMMRELRDTFGSRGDNFRVVAIYMAPDGDLEAVDGLDRLISKSDIKKFRNIIGL